MSYSASKSPGKRTAGASATARAEGIGRLSAPFVKDTSVIIEKFVEAVKDLFQYCYTDKELYAEIHKMRDDELFANLSEYLEEIKFAIFDALSQNLDKISLKFLQLCDKEEKFNKYLKILKERWRNSSSGIRPYHRHDDRYIRSAKDFVNKLAAEDAATDRSRSKGRRSPIKPQIHTSDFDSINKTRRPNATNTRSKASLSGTHQDMPLMSSGFGNSESNRNLAGTGSTARLTRTPGRANGTSTRGVGNGDGGSASPQRSPVRSRSKTRYGAVDDIDKIIEMKEDLPNFVREVIDPNTGLIIKCLCPTEANRMFLGLEMGKIVEVITETPTTPKVTSLIYSGTHTVYDLVMDSLDRLFFFDGSYTLRMISYNSSKTEEVCQGEYWGMP